MRLYELVVDALAVWRIASMITSEDGPGDVFATLRDRLAPVGKPMGFWGSLVTCLWCSSVWVAAGVGLLRWAAPWASAWPLRALALSALALAYDRLPTHTDRDRW